MLVNIEKYTWEQYTRGVEHAARLFNADPQKQSTTARILLAVGESLRLGGKIGYSARHLSLAARFIAFWRHIGHIHASRASNEGMMLMRKQFPAAICATKEICAWLQKKHTGNDWLRECLALVQRPTYYDDLVSFRNYLAREGIKFKIDQMSAESTAARLVFWRNFDRADYWPEHPRGHIVVGESSLARVPARVPEETARNPAAAMCVPEETKRKSEETTRKRDASPARKPEETARKRDASPARKHDVSPPHVHPIFAGVDQARAWLSEKQFVRERIRIAGDDNPTRDSSPRPCRCGETECWCLDPREIRSRK